jgi:hypothetical protein
MFAKVTLLTTVILVNNVNSNSLITVITFVTSVLMVPTVICITIFTLVTRFHGCNNYAKAPEVLCTADLSYLIYTSPFASSFYQHTSSSVTDICTYSMFPFSLLLSRSVIFYATINCFQIVLENKDRCHHSSQQ